MRLRLTWVPILTLLAGCATAGARTAAVESARVDTTVELGRASYYAAIHAGRRAASGEIYDPSELTAAHRTLPFGTRVRVTNLVNDRSVVVRINDRGPFRRGRIIDVSRAAARKLDFIREGLTRVRVEVLDD